MKPSKTTPDCVRIRKLQESFINKQKTLKKELSDLAENISNISLMQLQDVRSTYSLYQEKLQENIAEYVWMTNKKDIEYEKLSIAYTQAIIHVDNLINLKYLSGEK
jgi:alpha-galactosidase